MRAKDIDDLLRNKEGHRSSLQRLLGHAENLRTWTAELRAVLDDKLRFHFEVGKIKGEVFFLICRNAAVATRLRFQSEDIISRLKPLQTFQSVTRISVKVADTSTP